MIVGDQSEHIAPQESKISLSIGKILLKLSAHFNESETAINFLTKQLLHTVTDCESSQIDIIESLKQLETLKKNFFSKNFCFNSPEEIFIVSIDKQHRNCKGNTFQRRLPKLLNTLVFVVLLMVCFQTIFFFENFFPKKNRLMDISTATEIPLILRITI